MATIDFAKLETDLRAGLIVAKKVAEASHDGGTCNFDAPMLHFDQAPSPAVRAQFDRAVEAAGLRSFWTSDAFGKHANRRFVFGPGCGGQGYSRTKAAETLKKHLVDAGWSNVGMYYQCD